MNIENMQYHPLSEQLVKVLLDKTQATDPHYFRVLVAYYFSLAASHMRAKVVTQDRGDIPINLYALNLAPSGFGKTMSTNFMESEVLGNFRYKFLEDTFPSMAEINLPKLANRRAIRNQTDPEQELASVEREFVRQGPMLFSFDSGTSPAVKQLRHKLLMANVGSLNLIMDEVGLNLSDNKEVFKDFIELYDVGLIKQKLVKYTNDNQRSEEIIDKTPSNLLMFGVPSKLLDNGKTESDLMSLLDTGYARRCFFAHVERVDRKSTLSAEEIFEMRSQIQSSQFIENLSEQLEILADASQVDKSIEVPREVSIKLIEYRNYCERRAREIPNPENSKQLLIAELEHRDFKVLKLAGAYAFMDNSMWVTEEHLDNAIKLAEDSGEAFRSIVERDRPWVRLAKYIAEVGDEVTQADLSQDLPIYSGPKSAKDELLTNAIAWGYKNNVIIKKRYEDGIEFLRGESLDETSTDKMIIAYSNQITEGYQNEYAPFEKLHQLTQQPNMHWINHHLDNGYRNEEHIDASVGTNMLVLDVDNGTRLEVVRELLRDYKYHIYTTKRHTPSEHRFRIILPLSHVLKLDIRDYKEFMNNVFEFLPFDVDTQTGQRARKWLTHKGHYEYNDGELFDAMPFIPRTAKNDSRLNQMKNQSDLDRLERWIMNNSGDGNRNNMLLRYGLILVDSGFKLDEVRTKLLSLNDKLPDKLSETEILSTILVTVSKKLITSNASNDEHSNQVINS